ncbi:MAG: iron uptake porin, partial [Cyanobacteriota bacterium]
MKPFQQLLRASIGAGLLAPLAVSAADINLNDVNRYAASGSADQVTSVNQFADVRPTDWAYQALSDLIERYGCVAGYPDGTFRGSKPLTRYEAAALLNACLDRVTEVTDELKRLMKEFEAELAVLRGRVDGLEARVGEIEATQFSTTTKLQGQATFVLGAVEASGNRNGVGVFGGTAGPTGNLNGRNAAKNYNRQYGATTFNYDYRLNFITSFSGKDQLYARLRSGNFNNAFNGNGVNLTALDVASNGFGQTSCTGNRDCSDVIGIDRLYYRFPVGSQFEFLVGSKARNTEFLGMSPGVYGSGQGDRILDYFAMFGAPGVYNKATGSMVGAIWKTPYKVGPGKFSLTTSYVSPVADVGSVNSDSTVANRYYSCSTSAIATDGGIGNDCSRASWLLQLGYAAKGWGLSAGYRYGQAGSNARRGTNFVAQNSWWLNNGTSNNFALNGYWQPKRAGILPSLSAGWGISSLRDNSDGSVAFGRKSPSYEYRTPYVSESQSWFVGLQWADVFLRGNAFGMAFGQPTFATSLK